MIRIVKWYDSRLDCNGCGRHRTNTQHYGVLIDEPMKQIRAYLCEDCLKEMANEISNTLNKN